MAYNIIFCGTPDFAVPSLKSLHNDPRFNIVRVYTQPDRPSGRGKKLQASPVKKVALELGLEVHTPEKISTTETIDELKKLSIDGGVVVAYGQILSKSFLEALPKGCVNIHSSLLPRWRGAAPMQRALMAGDKETGVSLQKVVKKLDAGDIIAEERMALPLFMGAIELYETLSLKGARLLTENLQAYYEGQKELAAQDESKITYAKKIEKQEGKIDWKNEAMDIHNKIRGLEMGGPNASSQFRGKNLKIHKSQWIEVETNSDPGVVVNVEKESFDVACGKNAVRLLMVQPESKAKMSAADYIRGYQVKKGDQFDA